MLMYLESESVASDIMAESGRNIDSTEAEAFGVRTFSTPVDEPEAKKSIEDIVDQLEGKRVRVRCHINVPLYGKTITDDTRIHSSVPTIQFLKEKGANALGTSQERTRG